MSSTPEAQVLMKADGPAPAAHGGHKSTRRQVYADAAHSVTSRDILLFLIAFRILNALSIRTFFQPDEYFQSLEPAWQMAFGVDSGAWITWEWKHHLRSAIHPLIFTIVYYIASVFSQLLQLSLAYRADVLIAAPKVVQAVFAACGDYYTWKLAKRVYGHGSNEAWAALALTVCSPWQWFCSSRTLSNSLETTLTIAALTSWPWQWPTETLEEEETDGIELRMSRESTYERSEVEVLTQLRQCLLLAALACVLRPTNLLVWICVASSSLVRAKNNIRMVLIRETILCGSFVLVLSTLLDRFYYQTWTFPPLRFLYFNIHQSLAVFYGKNDWHYYVSQGYPLLLTTFLPFGLVGIYRALIFPPSPSQSHSQSSKAARIRYQLATTALVVPVVLSLVSHKEVRFIYPLLPILHVLAAQPFTSFFLPAVSPASAVRTSAVSRLKTTLLALILAANIGIGLYTTSVHQSGVLSVLDYLRHEYEHHYLTQPPAFSHIAAADSIMTVGFLMPCHSTPWRSHLVHSGIEAWALGCEPPVNLNATERTKYVDEADRFYASPTLFMAQEMSRPPRVKSSLGFRLPRQGLGHGSNNEDEGTNGKSGRKQWPEYLVFFQQAEETMQLVLRGSGYRECWRGSNSHWHDDWRRKGDVMVWCSKTSPGGKEKAP